MFVFVFVKGIFEVLVVYVLLLLMMLCVFEMRRMKMKKKETAALESAVVLEVAIVQVIVQVKGHPAVSHHVTCHRACACPHTETCLS